jgi:hypothetical protein
MFPVLVWMYARLAKREEQEAVVELVMRTGVMQLRLHRFFRV